MIRVRVGAGPVWVNDRHPPGEEVRLVGERKFYPSNLPPHTTSRGLASTTKAR